MNMLRLNVFIQVSADNRAAVMEAAKELVACSLKDNGCIAYDIFERESSKSWWAPRRRLRELRTSAVWSFIFPSVF